MSGRRSGAHNEAGFLESGGNNRTSNDTDTAVESTMGISAVELSGSLNNTMSSTGTAILGGENSFLLPPKSRRLNSYEDSLVPVPPVTKGDECCTAVQGTLPDDCQPCKTVDGDNLKGDLLSIIKDKETTDAPLPRRYLFTVPQKVPPTEETVEMQRTCGGDVEDLRALCKGTVEQQQQLQQQDVPTALTEAGFSLSGGQQPMDPDQQYGNDEYCTDDIREQSPSYGNDYSTDALPETSPEYGNDYSTDDKVKRTDTYNNDEDDVVQVQECVYDKTYEAAAVEDGQYVAESSQEKPDHPTDDPSYIYEAMKEQADIPPEIYEMSGKAIHAAEEEETYSSVYMSEQMTAKAAASSTPVQNPTDNTQQELPTGSSHTKHPGPTLPKKLANAIWKRAKKVSPSTGASNIHLQSARATSNLSVSVTADTTCTSSLSTLPIPHRPQPTDSYSCSEYLSALENCGGSPKAPTLDPDDIGSPYYVDSDSLYAETASPQASSSPYLPADTDKIEEYYQAKTHQVLGLFDVLRMHRTLSTTYSC